MREGEIKEMDRFWNFVQNEQNDEEVELRISGEIVDDDVGWIYEWFGIPAASPNAFRKELAKYKGKNIKVWIDSYGGDVFAGAGIYNALKEHDGKVITVVDGKAMSAASVIAMAGDETYISPVGILMIHNPWSKAVGEAKDMRHAADVLDEVKETIVNAYQLKTEKSRKKISEMMDNETFMSAKTAMKEGFVDKILYTDKEDSGTEQNPVENNFMFSRMLIQNSLADSMKKFIEVAHAQSNDDQQSVSQPTGPDKDPAANNKNNKNGEEKPMDIQTVEELKNAYPELVKQIEDNAREEGAKNERARIQDIEKISRNIAPDLVNKAKFENPVDAKDLAFQAIQADTQKGNEFLLDVQDDAVTSNANNVTANPVEQKTKAEQKQKEEQSADVMAAAANVRRNK